MSGAVAVAAFEPQHDLADAVAFRPFIRNGRAADVAAQPFALVALVGAHRYAGVQAESAHIACSACLRRVTGGQCLQRQHLAPGLRSHGNAPGDGGIIVCILAAFVTGGDGRR